MIPTKWTLLGTAGVEPAAIRLKARCSTTELRTRVGCVAWYAYCVTVHPTSNKLTVMHAKQHGHGHGHVPMHRVQVTLCCASAQLFPLFAALIACEPSLVPCATLPAVSVASNTSNKLVAQFTV